MRGPRSLQLRLALALGLAVTVMWLLAAGLTAQRLRHELDMEFDSALRDTAHRLLPLVGREEPDRRERNRKHGEEWWGRHERDDEEEFDDDPDRFSYVIRDAEGSTLLLSEGADAADFPPFEREGFLRTESQTFFYDRARRADSFITIAVAEPLTHRVTTVREMTMSLSLPLLLVIQLSLVAIFLVVRYSLAPMRRLRDDLGRRSAHNLAPVGDTGLPSELRPVVGSINALLARLGAAFEAERSFAANAVHELRTPVAGAIAQAQRLKAETADTAAAARAGEIESTLKRLNSLSEKLMQLARAEGARLTMDEATDLRPILRMIVGDFERLGAAERIELVLPEQPVLSKLDPDGFGILARNLIENALKHGAAGEPVKVALTPPAVLRVCNCGVVIPPDELDKLTGRFVRSNGTVKGSGLGLAIVRTIAERAGATLELRSPVPGTTEGVEVRVALPGTG
ncbi:sensor histidine kinase [Aliiruegeria lutimaris]|uniref:histidine kinase n=1 Tax=Aliiruegeria lutimaris TaxID=571298 RepID=A0A1G8IIC2_9RHOB|nr:HAMP domain-containing sensor histidine kinase [Aliiruegeria lutimaris]SDI18654.1 two-component system, OmpR family, sensor kinase [Aliiruegeria lutimaris]